MWVYLFIYTYIFYLLLPYIFRIYVVRFIQAWLITFINFIILKCSSLVILIVSTLNFLLSDISIAKFALFWLPFPFHIFFHSFTSTFVYLQPACGGEQKVMIHAVWPPACLLWSDEEQNIHPWVSSWSGSSLFHLGFKGPASLSSLTVPVEGDRYVGCSLLGVAEAEKRESKDGQLTSAVEPQVINRPVNCPRALTARPLQVTTLLTRNILGATPTFIGTHLHGVWAVTSFFNPTPIIFHLSESYQMFFGQLKTFVFKHDFCNDIFDISRNLGQQEEVARISIILVLSFSNYFFRPDFQKWDFKVMHMNIFRDLDIYCQIAFQKNL